MNSDELRLYESPAIIKHIEILQSIISRMSSNSAACKTLTLTLISALIALSLGYNCFPVWICLIPAVLMYILDSFYLGLEKQFIVQQRILISKIASGTIQHTDIFVIKSNSSFAYHVGNIVKGLKSFSTTFFYTPLMLLILFLWITVV